MDEKKTLLTEASFQKLADELEDLKVNKRPYIAEKIKEAREQGDLSENAEYDAAKDEQRDIEARIDELEEIIKYCEVVDSTKQDTSKVHLGCTVTIQNRSNKKKYVYQIVSPTEVNSRAGKISYASPVGKAIDGKEVGDKVTVETPNGNVGYVIVDIEKSNE